MLLTIINIIKTYIISPDMEDAILF